MRVYDTPFGPTAVTVAVDVVELTPADDKPLIVLRATIEQTTEVGDVQEEFIPISWVRGNTTSGSGGTAAAAPSKRIPANATAGFTFESLNTTQASAGTPETLAPRAWSVRGGLDYVFLPEERITVTQAQTLMCWRLGGAPADSVTTTGNVAVAEMG